VPTYDVTKEENSPAKVLLCFGGVNRGIPLRLENQKTSNYVAKLVC